MIDSVLIDANGTLEDFSSFAGGRDQRMKGMAQLISSSFGSISASQLIELYEGFCLRYGPVLWEHHPVFWRSVLKAVTNTNPMEQNVRLLYDEYVSRYAEEIRLFPDALPFIKEQSQVRKLALVANGNSQRLSALICRYSLDQYFTTVALSGDCYFKKPEPFLFEYALKELGSTAERAVMIGDRHTTDILGAKSIGMRSIHLSRERNLQRDPGKPWLCADATVRTLGEVPALLDHEPSFPVLQPPREYRREDTVIRDAIVMCGGRGRRMGDLTDSLQKCALPLAGIPILDYVVRSLAEVGCSRIFLVLGYRDGDIRSVVGTGEQYGVTAEYVCGDFRSTLEGVLACLPHIDDVFYYVHGNILYPVRLLEGLWLEYCTRQCPILALVPIEDDLQHARVQVAEAGVVKNIACPPADSLQARFTFLGLAIYQKAMFTQFSGETSCLMAEAAAASYVARRLPAGAFVHKGRWRHYETTDDYDRDREKSPTQAILW